MSTYGKFKPNKSRNQPAVQRRNTLAVPFSLSDSKTGLELGEIREQKEHKSPPNEQPANDQSAPDLIVKNSAFRLVNSVVPQIAAEVHTVFRVVWVLIYLGLFGVFLFSFYEMVDKYTNHPTTFDLMVETDANLDFPAVTVCNENPVKKSYMKYFIDISDILILDSYLKNFINFYEPEDRSGKISEAGCPQDFFVCEDKRNCIPHQWICDGKMQCEDGSDEKMDNERCFEANRWRIENNGSSYFCVPPYMECRSAQDYFEYTCAKVCDGVVECQDAVDEINQDCPQTYETCELLFAETDPKTVSFPFSEQNCSQSNSWRRVIRTIDSSFIKINLEFLQSEPPCDSPLLISGEEKSAEEALAVLHGNQSIGEHDSFFCIAYINTGEISKQEIEFNSSVVTIFFQYEPSSPDNDYTQFTTTTPVPSNLFNLTFHTYGQIQPDIAVNNTNSGLADLIGDDYFAMFQSNFSEDYLAQLENYLNNIDDSAGPQNDYFATVQNFNKTLSENCSSDSCSRNETNNTSTWSNFQNEKNLTTSDIKMKFLSFTADYYKLYNFSTVDDYSDFYATYNPTVFDRFFTSMNGNLSDFVVQCSYDDENCGEEVFSHSEDFMLGACYTFHPNRIPRERVGDTSSLKMTLFVDSNEYMGPSQNTGVRIAIHEPGTSVTMDNRNIAASVGETTFVEVTSQRIERLGGKYGNCMRNFPKFAQFQMQRGDNYKYTLNGCEKLCLSVEVVKNCNCYDQFFFYDFTNLTMRNCLPTLFDEDKQCIDDVYRRHREKIFTCPCELQCNLTEYNYVTSRSNWPSESYSSYLTAKLIKSKSNLVRSFVKQLSNNSESNIRQSLRDNFVRLEITFKNSFFKKISEKPAYTISDLISDFGGNISLWLGWSIFALFEVLIFLMRCAQALYVKVKAGNDLKK